MKEILQSLQAILARGYNTYDVFNDWLDLMIYALQRDDDHYLEIVRKYKNDKNVGEREIDYFCKAFAQLQIEMQKTNNDVLGEVYMEWNMSNKYRGQFFTPKHVAAMMATMLNPKGKVLDPCCGSGVLLVEALKTMDSVTLDSSLLCGQDVDLTCVKMCALNLMFFNTNGYVVWGDSLMLECRKVYKTSRSIIGGSIQELTGEAFESFKQSYIPSIEKVIKESPHRDLTQEELSKLISKGEQLSFF